jgi:hypothetical protein
MDRKSAGELQDHMLGTYASLRVGLAVIAAALPLVVLFAGSALHHVWLEPSISRYYHTPARLLFLTTRDLFVGGLFAAAACLYLYKGFSTRENVALNLAGVFAALVALLPTAAGKGDHGIVPTLHRTSAVLFFVSIAYVSLFRSRDTLRLLPPEKQKQFAPRYFWTGVAMLVSPAGAIALSLALDGESRFRTLVFWVETLGVWAFAAYWVVKTLEMRETAAERRALDAELRRETVPAASRAGADAGQPGGVSGAVLRTLDPKSGEVERIVPAVPPDVQSAAPAGPTRGTLPSRARP